MIGLRVSKLMFFANEEGGTLRFIEHAPVDAHESTDHEICGCTRSVSERPKGKPFEVRPEIVLHARRDPFTIEFDLTSLWVTFKFGGPKHGASVGSLPAVEGAAHPGRRRVTGEFYGIKVEPHAYFMFGFGDGPLRIEITLPGYGLTDVLFANVYIGNQIDTTRMMNGHAPSRIVDLSKIGPDDVWVHESSWGLEAMRTLPPSDAKLFREMNDDMKALRERIRPYALDMVEGAASVEEVRRRVMEDETTMRFAQKNIEPLAELLLNLPKTELYKAVLSVDRELWDKAGREMRLYNR